VLSVFENFRKNRKT